ncbi:hypothetical protein MINTM025_19390 [Mycobacterium intracellulare]|nr:hypothetical protein MINTM025_19390 [Mycobacterium intracellulare]
MGDNPPGIPGPPLSCLTQTARSKAGIQANTFSPPAWACFGARAAKGKILQNVRKTLMLAAVTGTLVTIPSATAHADEAVSFDPNIPAAAPDAPAPDAPAPDAPPAPPGPGRPSGSGCPAGARGLRPERSAASWPGRPAAPARQGVQRQLGRHRAVRVGR